MMSLTTGAASLGLSAPAAAQGISVNKLRTSALAVGSRTPLPAGTTLTASFSAGFCVAAVTNRRANRTIRRAETEVEAEAAKSSTTSKVKVEPPFDPQKEPGATKPLDYFDPLGFSKVGDKEGFYHYRAAELKHGRIAMFAALGGLLQHNMPKLPGFEQVPSGWKAAITVPGTYGLAAIFVLASIVEVFVWKQDPTKEPGNFGDPAGFGQYYKDWRNRELNNGRFGMVAMFAIIGTELLTGRDGFDQIWTPVFNLTSAE